MKTRGRPSTKAKKEDKVETPLSTEPKIQLGPDIANPPQLFILPKNISKDARIVSIENPRTSDDSRYVVCPERGFYEFTKVAAPRTTPRSWLLSSADSKFVEHASNGLEDSEDKFSSNGYVMRDASLFVATAIDPLFFVLPVLAPLSASKGSESKKLFLSGEDYLEKVTAASPQLSTLLRVEYLRTSIEKRMAAVCDTVDAGDETMYRLSEEKMLKELFKKAKKMSDKGLPASMEETFVRKALEVPIMSIKREDSSLVSEETPTETPDSQSTAGSADTAARSFSETSTAATSFAEDSQGAVTRPEKIPAIHPINAPAGVADLLRLRTALFFICSNYIPPHLSQNIKKLILDPTSPIDLAPLEAHLAHLAKLRQEALAARQLGGFSQKRSLENDEDGGEGRAEKKRKLEEEEKRKKAGESRGVKNLKKVNTTGMKKMSDFFKKK